MRYFLAAIISCGLFTASAPTAHAEDFSKDLRACKPDSRGVRETKILVPAAGSGTETVSIVSHAFTCKNPRTKSPDYVTRLGLKNAAGKLIVPVRYQNVLPFSPEGAVVRAFGKSTFNVYKNGKEGAETFDFQEANMVGTGAQCRKSHMSTGGASTEIPIGEVWFNVGKGRSHVTLFTPEGKARKLEYMGGDGIKRAVERFGDILVARWRDDIGTVRSGMLDLTGNQIAPVLTNAIAYTTLPANQSFEKEDPTCMFERSHDLFIEGPLLDYDPSRRFYGPLLFPVARNGQPMALPKDAIGMFPLKTVEAGANRGRGPATYAWAVVYPNANGFEFTMHIGTPQEALVLADTSPRYLDLGRAGHDIILAQAKSDGLWYSWRPNTTIPLATSTDFDTAANEAVAIIDGEVRAFNEGQRLKEEAVAAQKRADADQRRTVYLARLDKMIGASEYCAMAIPFDGAYRHIEAYVSRCEHNLTYADLDRAHEAGVPQALLDKAREARKQEVAAAAFRQKGEDQAAIDAVKGNSSYIPGQWEAAIRNAGDAMVADINKSSENWLQQRRDQYRADWQRSQRAY